MWKLQQACRWMAGLMALSSLALKAECETMLPAQAAREHPDQAKLVNVGHGRRIQIDCRGEEGPTVVFQSGGDVLGSAGWGPVLEKVSAHARACAYSRAGIMWSDPA